MVHELLGITNNRVDLRPAGSKIAKENQELVLSAEQDAFFHTHMYSTYGAMRLCMLRAVVATVLARIYTHGACRRSRRCNQGHGRRVPGRVQEQPKDLHHC